jgi:hypothetical protein
MDSINRDTIGKHENKKGKAELTGNERQKGIGFCDVSD